ncbi:MAG: type IV pilus assembly protein PilM [Candidatus Eisenbacteria bacterium]|nr:type IV pilus assembly protein PilM [Candidatus Eisenbacteria bacterium]
MNLGLRARPWAGLDIGEYSVKLLALQPGVGHGRHYVAEAPLRRLSNDVPLPPDAIARALGECFSLAGLSARSFRGFTLGVSGSDVIVKQVPLPLMDDAEVAGALRFEARKHLPFDPATCILDYQILGRYPSEKRLDVLLAAVPQSRLDRALAPLKMLGVEADIVDAAPLALTNALARTGERDTDARVMLDFGHTGSWLTLYQRGSPYFARRLDFGGMSVTQAISSALRVPFEEAEEWKLAAGDDDPNMRVSPDSPEMLAVRGAVRTLADELHRSFAFYRTLAPLPGDFSLWLSGGTARLPGIAGLLSEALDVPTLVFNPLDVLGADLRALPPGGPQFSLAYGLALRAA